MKKRHANRTRSSGDAKDQNMLVRMTSPEKEGFKRAASLAGQDLSVWVRDRLRRAAQTELTEAGQTIPFLRLQEQ